MSRDSNGAHSLPAGNPVSSGTTISSSVHNATTSDLSAEITDSLSRSGKGGMTAPLKGVDGSAAAPAVSFTSEPGTGLYRAGANNPAISVSGTKRLECTSAGAAVTGTLAVSGATALAALATTGDVAVATNKFTVAAATGNTAVAGTLGVTGVATFSAGLSTHAAISPPLSGDAVVVRTAAPTTGLVQLGNAATENVAFDGTRYLHGSTDKPVQVGTALTATDAASKGYVDAVPRFVVAGYIRGSDGVILSQTGSLTASAVRTNPGEYTITVAGLTTSAIVVATSASAATPSAVFVIPGTGSFGAQNQAIATHSAQDGDFTFAVLKL
jgi:hypothetical protein